MIQEYDFVIEHIAGNDNVHADAFSRADFNYLDVNHLSQQMSTINLATLATGITPDEIPGNIRLILESHHNDVYGHHGIHRMYQMIQQTFHKMKLDGKTPSEDIGEFPYYCRLYVNQCVKCQMFKQIKPIIHARKYTCASYKIEYCRASTSRIPHHAGCGNQEAMDIVGPPPSAFRIPHFQNLTC